jgi:hypothetical protein
MNLNEISRHIGVHLESLQDTRTLPNAPNLGGSLNETSIVFIIQGGSFETPSLINLDLKVSIACDFREESQIEDKRSLNELISLIISSTHNTTFPNCRKTQFSKFEIFTPDSGKWRSLIEFTVPSRIEPRNDLEHSYGKLREVDFNYDYQK